MIQLENNKTYWYQWDLNQRVILTDITSDQVDNNEVHFSGNVTTGNEAFVVIPFEEDGVVYASVPNILFTIPGAIQIYLYVTNGDESHTLLRKTVKVIEREKPTDYVYTKSEVLTWEKLDDRLSRLEGDGLANVVADYLEQNPVEAGATKEEAEQIEKNTTNIENLTKSKLDVDKLPEVVNDALAQAKESGEFDGNDYVLTEADKDEIAEMAAEKVAVPESSVSQEDLDAVTDTIPNSATVNDANELVMQRTEGDAVSELFRVGLPLGGGTGGGGFGLGIADNYDIELITQVFNIDQANIPTRIDITQKDDGTSFAYDGIIIWTDAKDSVSYTTVVFNKNNLIKSSITHGDKTCMSLFITDGATMFCYKDKMLPTFVLKQSRAEAGNMFYPDGLIQQVPEKFTTVSFGAYLALGSITFYKIWGLKKK